MRYFWPLKRYKTHNTGLLFVFTYPAQMDLSLRKVAERSSMTTERVPLRSENSCCLYRVSLTRVLCHHTLKFYISA